MLEKTIKTKYRKRCRKNSKTKLYIHTSREVLYGIQEETD